MLIGIDASRALRARRTGTERYALEIIRHLLKLPAATGHRWRLYVDTLDAPILAEWRAGPAPVELYHLPARRLWTHRQLARAVIHQPPDVLFIPAHVLPFVLPTRRLPPSVVTIHDLGYHYFPHAHPTTQRLYLTWSTRWSATAATQLIAVSQATADDLVRFTGVAPAKIQVIHEARSSLPEGDTQTVMDVRERYGLRQPYALYVGTLQPRKNLVRLVRAYAQLRQRQVAEWELVLAGGQGWQAEPLAALVQEFALGAVVRFLNYVPDPDLPTLYRGARFFCFPSLFEGFGLPILEAQFYGVPVMSANNSAMPEIAGDAALLVDPTDVDAIAEAMLRLSQDEALRQQLIAAGHENVKRFSWEKAARATLAVLEAAARTVRKQE
jgi:glycosyltransferase involved in cell wall biosynthesis